MKLKPLVALASAAGLAALLVLTVPGCGAGLSKTQAKVIGTDGKPVHNATVTLIPQEESASSKENASSTATGLTDESGMCVLETNGKQGVPKGKYKVLVVKGPQVQGGGQDGDIMQKMKDQMGNMPMGGAGAKPPGGFKSELPAKYADARLTPFVDIAVPAPNGVIELTLKE
jgi:hypothetical protein